MFRLLLKDSFELNFSCKSICICSGGSSLDDKSLGAAYLLKTHILPLCNSNIQATTVVNTEIEDECTVPVATPS